MPLVNVKAFRLTYPNPKRSSFSHNYIIVSYIVIMFSLLLKSFTILFQVWISNIFTLRFYSSRDEDGAVIRPLPKVKQSLSDPAHLPHVVQLLLTFDPVLVWVSPLLKAIVA